MPLPRALFPCVFLLCLTLLTLTVAPVLWHRRLRRKRQKANNSPQRRLQTRIRNPRRKISQEVRDPR